MPYSNWQVEFDFKIHGVSSYISGDGFAFWATKERLNDGTFCLILGPIFGNQDHFTGLGIIFDTYANVDTTVYLT